MSTQLSSTSATSSLYSPSYSHTSFTSSIEKARRESRDGKLRCCRCFEVRIGIFILGLWSIIVTVGYYIGFLMFWYRNTDISYPFPILYGMAAIGFIGGSFGMLAATFESLLFSKAFFIWAVVRFFSQFAEGILYAAAGYSWYILFFIDFIVWGYFIIVINQYIQLLKSNNKHKRRLMTNTQNYQSTLP